MNGVLSDLVSTQDSRFCARVLKNRFYHTMHSLEVIRHPGHYNGRAHINNWRNSWWVYVFKIWFCLKVYSWLQKITTGKEYITMLILENVKRCFRVVPIEKVCVLDLYDAVFVQKLYMHASYKFFKIVF